jgi:predicted DsbA family dithiol-disulfide isomerase
MNALVPRPARLAVEVVFDFVCPWCYLGISRLDLLLARRRDLDIELSWRPFLLNPDMPRGGMPRGEYLIRKFGAEDRARRLYASIARLGAAEGIALDFAAIGRAPNSVDAHRLVRWAARRGLAADELVHRIFRAHFAAGLDIGSHAILARLATEIGMDGRAVVDFLATDEGVETIHTENLHAHRLGINGVPCFIAAGEYAIAGAQEGEVLERLLDAALCIGRNR